MNDITITIAGEAGQGLKTLGHILCRILKDSGFFIFADQDYMSRIRGGLNMYMIRISEAPVYSLSNHHIIAVSLTEEAYDALKDNMAEYGVILYDRDKFELNNNDDRLEHVPFNNLAKEVVEDTTFMNTVVCGVICRILRISKEEVQKTITRTFLSYGDEVVEKNKKAVLAGYQYDIDIDVGADYSYIKRETHSGAMLINGNEAIALGAIKAGCKFYAAYPMTPATSILTTMAARAEDFGIIVEQAEDELAAVNMAIGASFAGARAMTGTSGGGFALMTEGLSLAAMTETPLVIAEVQRPGPATGLPTRTGQSDLDFVLYGGHGEFVRAVFTPGTAEECFMLTFLAFDLAEKYQITVIILSDRHVADSLRCVTAFDNSLENTRHIYKENKNSNGYKRYAYTEDGVSPRAIPSLIEDPFYVDSDEHTEEGHITESGSVRNRMMEKRYYRRMQLVKEAALPPQKYQCSDAEIIIAGFGSTYGVIREACDRLRADGIKVGALHFTQVFPFPEKAFLEIRGKKRLFTVENNAGAQFAGLIRRETGANAEYSLLQFDGRPCTVEDVTDRLRERIGK